MTLVDDHRPGLYWQSLMGNNDDGIGGNCHRYDLVTGESPETLLHEHFLVDFGVKFGNGGRGYSAEFASPEGILARRDSGKVDGGGRAPEALILTHAHEDHVGAIRHVLDMGYACPPVYATAFTAAMLNKSLVDAGIARDRWPEIRIARCGDRVDIGHAKVEFVAVDHMPGATALHIRSPEGSIFHTGDYRFDETLPLGDRASPERLRAIGKEGVDMVVSDSTSAVVRETPTSEAQICQNLSKLVADNEGRPITAGILGSQLDRLVSLARAAKDNGRVVAVSGRSLASNVAAARMAGLDIDAVAGTRILTAVESRAYPPEKVLMVTTGAFAQSNSGLVRAAHRQPGALDIGENTTVIIPQRAIPAVRTSQSAMVAKLEQRGARVMTAEKAVSAGYGAIHQSGHAVERDCKLLYSLLRPTGLVAPIHGDRKQVGANSRLARSLGIPAVVLDRNGAVVRVAKDGISIVGTEDVARIGARERADAVKQLPRAPRGQGRDAHFPIAVYQYDRLDASGGIVLKPDVHTVDGPVRPRPVRDAPKDVTVAVVAARRSR
ncbi:ribonuclease J [Telmatospirillum sp.]|uniref:ribonuclease J n=1 Tax=Telmatospirillum sp. TaxID=2079197 RepID=UPI002842E19E|nr:ribonuclease J [Telmatospirillum sp.]MDR3439231.1 ribonuclease J [Telmatospirillum sp.]